MDKTSLRWRYGLIGAATLVGYSLVVYFVNPFFLFTGIFSFLPIFIYAAFMAKGALEERKQNNGIISFREAASSGFSIAVVMLLAARLVLYILLLIDADLPNVQREATIDFISNWLVVIIGEQDVERWIIQTQQMNYAPSIRALLWGYMLRLLPSFLLAAIIALIVKSNYQNQ